MELKQVFLVRKDLKLSPGKLAAQVAHAAVHCAMKSDSVLVRDWESRGAKKIVLEVANEAELHKFLEAARDMKIREYLVVDAGHTEIDAGTETCLGLGPELEEKLDKLTGELKIL